MIEKYLNMTTLFVVPALALSGVIIALIVYLSLIEKPELSYQILPVPVMLKTVHAGQILPIKVSRCNANKQKRYYTSTRLLENVGEDQEMLVMEEVGVSVKPGCATQNIYLHRIPESAQPGDYRLLGVATVPGLIRNFYVTWYTENFKVVAKAKP